MSRRLGPLARLVLALEIVAVYLQVRVVVRRGPITVTVHRLRRARRRPQPDDPQLSEHLAWATVRTIELLPMDSRCLMRSLVLSRLMARRGLRSEFVLSVGTDSAFESHAWVEHAGVPLLQPGGPGHQPMLRV